jgi:hypothetical protein
MSFILTFYLNSRMNSDSLDEIKSYFDAKFADFKKEICKGSVAKNPLF